MNELAGEKQGYQQPFQKVIFKIRDDAAVIGEFFCEGEEIAESVDQHAIHCFLSGRAGIVGSEDNDPIFARQSLAQEMNECGFGISLPARVG